jgi:hypothetical protein
MVILLNGHYDIDLNQDGVPDFTSISAYRSYLELSFRGTDNQIHYGWTKLSTAAYVDQQGNLHAGIVLSTFAYETVPGQQILIGQNFGRASTLPQWSYHGADITKWAAV